MPVTTTYIVDGSDSHIDYIGGVWEEVILVAGNNALPFKRTLRTTMQSGNVSFSFSGSWIAAFGTVFSFNSAMGNKQQDSVFNCFIDNKPIPSTSQPLTGQPLCSNVTSDGNHNLTIVLQDLHQTIFSLDYLEFTSSNLMPNPGYSVRIDSKSPTIQYSPDWMPTSDNNATMTDKPGSNATVRFTGTKLTWIGFLSPKLSQGPMMISYTVDGKPEFPSIILGLPTTTQHGLDNQIVFFATPELAVGNHTVVVTYTGLMSVTVTPLVLDYLLIETATPPSSGQSHLPPYSPPPPVSCSPLPTSTSALRSSGVNAGKIAGGVIGGVVLLLLSVALCCLFIRRRRRSWHFASSSLEPPSHGPLSPDPQNPTVSYSKGCSKVTGRSTKSLDGCGYNEATIEQTRAVQKGEEAALEARRMANGRTSGSHLKDLLPQYSTN
ncbi:hypothetical protein H2248_004161 [Termitomyces sp. 'cryptogamus']|nr:hypothetical protein H2248_004161 [Termitomyces sp. 'cryptogamus']